jgi:hypothetical protein
MQSGKWIKYCGINCFSIRKIVSFIGLLGIVCVKNQETIIPPEISLILTVWLSPVCFPVNAGR